MSFYYLDQNIIAKNPFENLGFEEKFNLENFETMPPINSNLTDMNYQCSDNVEITGNTIGSLITNTALNTCKLKCIDEKKCIGFDYDNSSSTCSLKNTVDDLTKSKDNNVMCIKKTSSKCKDKSQIDPAIEAENIINKHSQSTNNKSSMMPNSSSMMPNSSMIPNSSSAMSNSSSLMPNSSSAMSNEGMNINTQNSKINNLQNTLTKPVQSLKSNECKPDTIFVDLSCFLEKMDVLKNHTDNMMIDLQLLISNLKSCSFVKKNNPTQTPNNENELKPINENNQNTDDTIMQPETIKVYNSKASILYTNNPSNNANMMLGLSEPFEHLEKQTPLMSNFTLKLIVLLIVLIFVMNI